MDLSEQRLYQLIQNVIQFGQTLHEIEGKVNEYQLSILLNEELFKFMNNPDIR